MNTVVIPHANNGVTTALVLFIFACVAMPSLIKNKTQFYAGFVATVLIVLLFSLALMLRNSTGFQVFAGVAIGLLQVFAMVALFLAAGGLTVKQLTGDLARAYEVIRRGEEEKEVVIPLPKDAPAAVQDAAAVAREKPTDAAIELPAEGAWPLREPPKPPQPPGT